MCWTRDQVLSYCDDGGCLWLEVTLQVVPDEKEVSSWKPGKSISTKVAHLYDSKHRADVTFVVENRRFCAHRLLRYITGDCEFATLIYLKGRNFVWKIFHIVLSVIRMELVKITSRVEFEGVAITSRYKLKPPSAGSSTNVV